VKVLSGFQMVVISLLGHFILSGTQMMGYQMPGLKAKWTSQIPEFSSVSDHRNIAIIVFVIKAWNLNTRLVFVI
jgi:hypothetical protein